MTPFEKQRAAEFIRNVVAALRTLLQEKHLYQSITVEPTDTYVLREADGSTTQKTTAAVSTLITNPWSLEQQPPIPDQITFIPPDLKLFCVICDRIEAFNLVGAMDVSLRLGSKYLRMQQERDQTFLFGYQCQSCKGTPEIFIVRRRDF